MKHSIITLAFLALFGLTGCGSVASPTHYEYDSHAVTTTTTTTTSSAAELSQDNNRPRCAGLVVIGSCNTVATQTQSTARPAAPARTPAAGGEDWAAVVCNSFLVAAAITALFVMLMLGLRGIFGGADER